MIVKFKNRIFNLLLIGFSITLLIFFLLILNYVRKFVKDSIEYRTTEIFPTLIASSNTDLLLREDFASLRVNLSNIVNSFENEGIAFIAVIDLYNEVTIAFNESLNIDDKSIISNRLRTSKEEFRFRREYYLNRTRDYIIEISIPLTIEDDNFGTIKIGYLKSFFNNDLVIATRFIILQTIFTLIIAGIILIIINHKVGSSFDEGFYEIRKDLAPKIRDNILKEFKKKDEESENLSVGNIPPQKMLLIINSIDKFLGLNDYYKLLEEVLLMIIKLYQSREASMYFISNDSELMTVANFIQGTLNTNQDDLNYLTIPLGEGDTGKAAQLNITVISDKPVPGYVISIPLTANNKVIGALRLSGKNDGTVYNQSDRFLSKIISSLIGNILNSKMQK
jgi:hypothetical protein